MYNGCIWAGYYWGGGDREWGRRRIDITKPEFERLVKPEAATPFDDPHGGWFPTFVAPTVDSNNLIVGSGDEIILLRFEEQSTDVTN